MDNMSVCNAVQQFLDDAKLKYSYVEEKKSILAGFNISGKIRNVKLLVDFNYEDCYIVLCPLSMSASEESYPELLRLINYINFTSKFGNFEMDEFDGEVRFRMAVDCEGRLPSKEMIERSIFLPLKMIQDYGGKIIEVMMGYKSFDIVKKEIDKDTD